MSKPQELVTLTIDGREIPCRTPRIAVNPAAAAMIAALGGTIPER